MINIHFSAVLLVLLTLFSTAMAQSTIQISVVAVLVTLSVIVKGLLITDIFMELNTAPSKWRWLLLSYVILVPLILAAIIYF
jgi:cytochrome c oxidase subunit 4